jgi:mRNA interferase HigB
MYRIIAKKILRDFWQEHDDAEVHLKTWYEIVRSADWKTPADIKSTFRSASILKDNRVVFNIKGNKYRLIVKFNYARQWAFIRFVGTHQQYDQIDADTV